MTTDESSTRSGQEPSETNNRFSRRGVVAAGITLGTTGCLGFFDGGSPIDSGSQGNADEYTTVPKTTTFAQVTGERTPYPSVQPVTLGEGRLLSVFFDYAQQASVDWWMETFPRIRDLVDGGDVRLSFGMYPVPESRWSVMVPCALLAVKNDAGNQAAVEFHRQVIREGPDYSMSDLTSVADEVGAAPATIERAARDRRRRNQVFSDKSLAVEKGIESPPGAIAGRERLPDASAETIRAAFTTETE